MAHHVFISYRREGGKMHARTLYERLERDGYCPFLDVDHMQDGHFDTQLLDRIAECTDFILMLSPGCLDRCVNEKDWVRREVAEALRLKKHIVPVLLPGFRTPDELPDEIDAIRMLQSVTANDDVFFNAYIQILEKALKYKPGHRRMLHILPLVIAAVALGAALMQFIPPHEPLVTPTDAPTATRTDAPTAAPTLTPTTAPTPTPSSTPTATPTPTTMPAATNMARVEQNRIPVHILSAEASVYIDPYVPSNTIDGKTAGGSNWQFEMANKDQAVLSLIINSTTVSGIKIANGYRQDEAAYLRNGRCRTIDVVLISNGQRITAIRNYQLSDSYQGRDFYLVIDFGCDYPEVTAVDIIPREVIMGAGDHIDWKDDIVISEIQIYSYK